MDSFKVSKCPECMSDNIETIPVEDHEKYNISINKIRGVDVEFSDDRSNISSPTIGSRR
jgi:hypothetical protein